MQLLSEDIIEGLRRAYRIDETSGKTGEKEFFNLFQSLNVSKDNPISLSINGKIIMNNITRVKYTGDNRSNFSDYVFTFDKNKTMRVGIKIGKEVMEYCGVVDYFLNNHSEISNFKNKLKQLLKDPKSKQDDLTVQKALKVLNDNEIINVKNRVQAGAVKTLIKRINTNRRYDPEIKEKIVKKYYKVEDPKLLTDILFGYENDQKVDMHIRGIDFSEDTYTISKNTINLDDSWSYFTKKVNTPKSLAIVARNKKNKETAPGSLGFEGMYFAFIDLPSKNVGSLNDIIKELENKISTIEA